VLQKIKELLHVPVLPYAGDLDTMVTKVAVLGGAGASFMDIVKASGAQLYVTGDVKYHDAQQAVKLGLVVADGGHFGTEIPVVADLQARLSHTSEAKGWDIPVITDPTSRNMLDYFINEPEREQK
jgi:putative NIF3 family GTP cyclohydrolase 1 type 2